MTIVSVTKSWSRSSGTGSTTDGQTFTLQFTEGWQVVHSADATDTEILSASGLPLITSKHPHTYAICKKIGPISRLGPIYSIVGVDYDGEIGPGQGLNDNPINKQPEYTWSDTSTNEPIDQDWDGKPIVTVNGEAIHGVTMEIADQTLTVTRNYATFSPWLTHQYRHSVNSDNFASYPPGTAKLVGFSATKEVADSFQYWKVNARIQFRFPYNTTPAKAWYARVRHEGFYERITAGGKPTLAVDEVTKSFTSKPVLLKLDGTRETNSDNAIWLEFKRYQSLPYTALGLV